MSGAVRGGSSCLLKLVGLAVILGGLSLALGAMMVESDSSIQGLMSLFTWAGVLIMVVGGAVLGLGSLLGGGGGEAARRPPSLSDEERQLRDSRAFRASREDHES